MNKAFFSCVCMLLAGHLNGMSQTSTVELKIIETSDVHGHFFPYDFVEGREMKGTLARASTYIKRQREAYGNRLLLIDNGDILQGQPCVYWSNYVATDQANLAAQVVNYMGYDVEAVGNHDIEAGHQVYDKWMSEVQCPTVGANIVSTDNQLPYVRPYAIVERQVGTEQPRTVRIAFIGMLTPTIPCWLNESLWKGLEFHDMVESARRWVKYVQRVEQPDLIFGLFHSGLNGGIVMDNGIEEDATLRVAQQVEGFDAIFFGHDHQVHNDMVKNPQGQDVLCIDPSCYVRNVAEATVRLTFDGKRIVHKDIKGAIVDVRNEPVDELMMAHFQPTIDRIKQFVGRRIGTFASSCSTRDSYFGNSAFTDFIHQLQLQLTGATTWK